jgi:hypothetical protein
MGSLSNYAENKWLDHILKTTSFTVPTNLYVALSTADPGESGSGLAEPSGNGYARTLMNSWATAASRATSNSGAVTFPAATGSWGTITHYAIFDASTAGNMIGYGSLTTPNAVVNGNVVVFAIGEIDVTVNSGGFSTYLANKMLDHTFKVASYTVPTNIYCGLSTANPGDSASGLAEPSGNAYARTVKNAWDTAASGASQNSSAITFPTATGSWGTITHAALFDASTAGNMLMYGALGTSQSVVNGNVVEFDTGALDVTLD